MSLLFKDCLAINQLPNISKWDTKNVTDIHGIFLGCEKLKYLPDISK